MNGPARFTVVNDGDTVSPSFDVVTFLDVNRSGDLESGIDPELGRLAVLLSLQAGEQQIYDIPTVGTLLQFADTEGNIVAAMRYEANHG